eukprot:2802644-Rhodomonas_salina.2
MPGQRRDFSSGERQHARDCDSACQTVRFRRGEQEGEVTRRFSLARCRNSSQMAVPFVLILSAVALLLPQSSAQVLFTAISQQESDANAPFSLIVNGSGFQTGHLYFCSFTCISTKCLWNAPKLSVAATWNPGTNFVTCQIDQWPYPAARTLFELNRGSTSTPFNGTAGGNIYTFKGSHRCADSLCSLCSLSALCSLLSALCSLLSALCSRPSAVNSQLSLSLSLRSPLLDTHFDSLPPRSFVILKQRCRRRRGVDQSHAGRVHSDRAGDCQRYRCAICLRKVENIRC